MTWTRSVGEDRRGKNRGEDPGENELVKTKPSREYRVREGSKGWGEDTGGSHL
jgi:hypothetical protein